VLPVVLVLIGLLALVMASFMFFVRAEVTGAQAHRDAQQAQLVAESGLHEVVALLRTAKNDSTLWWDVPAKFRHALVWAASYDREHDPLREGTTREDFLKLTPLVPAWRFSVVAQNLDGPEDTLRYGIMPEASKLHLNAASEAAITALLQDVLLGLRTENWQELVDALLDWLDEDDEPRPPGAESDYYNTLNPGYYAKNGDLDTVEELLMVKGFSAAVLFGEDVNGNGILDLNEDDGDASFPYYDNADGLLDRGLAPYVTVWSAEPGTDGQNVAGKINVNTAPLRVLKAIEGMPPEAAESIVAMRAQLDAQARLDPQWITQAGAPYETLQDKVTAQALQYRVEVVAYADHTKLARRHEWIVEMRGPIAQILYHRDLTRQGFAWPVNDETVVWPSE